MEIQKIGLRFDLPTTSRTELHVVTVRLPNKRAREAHGGNHDTNYYSFCFTRGERPDNWLHRKRQHELNRQCQQFERGHDG